MLTPETIAKLLDGSPHDRDRLARELIPMVEARVFYTLRAAGRSLDLHADFTQDVLASLFHADARSLRDWNPERGSLGGYLSMIVGRFVRRQTQRRSASSSSVDVDLEAFEGRDDRQDRELAYRAALEEIRDWLRDECSDKDRHRFEALYVEQRSLGEVADDEGPTRDALYTWASRFRSRLKKEFPHVHELIEWHDRDRDDDPKGPR